MIGKRFRNRCWAGAALVLVLLLAGCGAPGPLLPDERASRSDNTSRVNSMRPDVYRVVSGDTLYSIAFRYGLDWRELARWNSVKAPYTIRVGQRLVLRGAERMQTAVAASDPEPGSRPDRRAQPPPEPEARREAPTQRTEPEPVARTETPVTQPDPEPVAAPAPAQPVSVPPAPDGTRSVQGVIWRWPTAGRVARSFNASSTRKGILIAGREGQPVRAAAAGEVVYSGNGLIGYGELIIVKHSGSMLSAYAHNSERLIGEGQRVQAGQEIARMGQNEDAGSVLHFEIRRDGKPENPIGYLPRR